MFQTILYLNNDNCQTSSLQKKVFFSGICSKNGSGTRNIPKSGFWKCHRKLSLKQIYNGFSSFSANFCYIWIIFFKAVWKFGKMMKNLVQFMYLLNIFRLFTDTRISDFRYVQCIQSIDNNMVWLKKNTFDVLKLFRNYLILSYYLLD